MPAPWQLTTQNFLSEQEVEQLLEHVRNAEPRTTGEARGSAVTDQLIVEGLLYSGLRNTEFCGLHLSDTILGSGTSTLTVTGTRQNDRTVFVPGELSELIRRYARDVRPSRLPAGVSPDDLHQPLLLNERRRPYERTALYRRVVRILSQAGLAARASVQLLRHTYGYLAYKRTDGNLLFVQQQLGHAHPMVTAVYAEFVDFSYPDLANRVAGETLSPRPVITATDLP
jgi:integrase/recombinase XerD